MKANLLLAGLIFASLAAQGQSTATSRALRDANSNLEGIQRSLHTQEDLEMMRRSEQKRARDADLAVAAAVPDSAKLDRLEDAFYGGTMTAAVAARRVSSIPRSWRLGFYQATRLRPE